MWQQQRLFLLCGCGNGKVMHKHECFTMLLPLPHRMGSKPIYLWHVAAAATVWTLTLNPIQPICCGKKNAAAAAAAAAPCERTLRDKMGVKTSGKLPLIGYSAWFTLNTNWRRTLWWGGLICLIYLNWAQVLFNLLVIESSICKISPFNLNLQFHLFWPSPRRDTCAHSRSMDW